MKYLRGLDGVRGLSVIAVVWHHSRPASVTVPFASHGFLGVDVFFVLSGLLITALLLEEGRTQGRVSLTAFYWRRLLRIFPLYYGILVALTLYWGISTQSRQRLAFFNELPTNLVFLSNWFPSTTLVGVNWSLSTEEQFYLVWPPIVALLGRRSLSLLIGFLAVNQAVNFGWITVGSSKNITQVTFTPIILGSMLAFGLSSPRIRAWLEASTAQWRLYLAVVLMAAIASYPRDMQGAPRLCFHIATAWVLAGIVTRPESKLVRALEWRPLALVGAVSYGVYLLHEIVLDRTNRGLAALHLGDAWHFPVGAVATVAVACLSYRYFEAPLLRFKAWRSTKQASAA